MKFILCPIGTLGDVNPFIRIGQCLKKRGHQVTVVSISHYEDLVRQAGLEFEAFCDMGIFERGINDPLLWHPVRSFDRLINRIAIPAIEPLFRKLDEMKCAGNPTIVIGSLAMGAHMFAELHGFPLITLCLQPTVIKSIESMPVISGIPRWTQKSKLSRMLLYKTIDTFADCLALRKLNSIRGRLGLPQKVSHLLEWWMNDHPVIALFPEWFASRQNDWGKNIFTTDFPLLPPGPRDQLSPELLTFVARGDAPVLFTFGTGKMDWQKNMVAIRRLSEELDFRAIVTGIDAEDLTPTQRIYYINYADFSVLLPLCRLIVHHGGIGTTAEALRAGIPQLITPMAFDQPDNAYRIKSMGVGFVSAPQKLDSTRTRDLILKLLNSNEIRQRCNEIQQQFATGAGIEKICDVMTEIQCSD